MRQLIRDTLVLPGRDFVIETPAEAFELFRRFYPHSWKGAAVGPAEVALAVDGDRASGPLTGLLQAVFALEHAIESTLIADCRDRIALHAGGVVVAGRAHLVAGYPDAGKTTSTFQLLELGHGFLCEEIALVEPHTLAVAPHLRTLGLDNRYLDEYARAWRIERGEVHRLDDQLARYLPDRVCLEPARLETLFLPRFRPGERPRVEELDAAEVLPELLGYCFAPAVEEELLFDRVIAMLGSCRVVRVQFDGIATARALWERLLPPAARP